MRFEDQTEFYFLFNEKLINTNCEVSINVKNKKIDEILNEILKGTDVVYTISDRKIILAPSYLSESELQQKSISGTITDQAGMPLPGVTVLVKGTMNGTVTNADGEYSITDISVGETLQFSFVGMKTQEVVIASQQTIDIVMEPDAIGIEEVVAIGYGTMTRQAVTGAVAVAELEKYREVPVNNILETVKGTIPGLSVGATNTAGAVAGLQVRGQNSTGAGNAPLIVVDGAIYHGSLGDIASDDIENFTVLKDASAAAVYGARSANGVILIETKKGKGINGKAKFDVKASYGITRELEPLEVYDAEGYIQRVLDIRRDRGIEADPSKVDTYLEFIEKENYLATPDHKPTLTDPYGLIRQNGYNRKANISVSNSTEKSNYYISTSLIDQKGVVLNDKYKNLSTRVNISSDLTDWFNLGINSMYSIRDYSGSSPSIYRSTHFSPYATVYNEPGDPEGTYKLFPQSTGSFNSPFWDIATSDLDLQNNLNGVVTGIIKLPWIKGLSYNVTLSNSLRWSERDYFNDQYTLNGKYTNGQGSRAYSRTYNQLLDNIVKYKTVIAEKHKLDLTLLYSREKSEWKSMSSYAEDFDNTTLLDYSLSDGKIQKVGSAGGESASIGEMARATYTYFDKYTLTGTLRRDGFSAFSKNRKWGIFSSVGLNWVISNENFIENSAIIDYLALRASYGSNGNQSISPYSTLAKVETGKTIFYGDPSYTITQYIATFANNDLGWEKTTGLNMGLDFKFLGDRISGSLDVYKTNTTDQLFSLSLPKISGKSSILSNIGEIQNKGFELELHSANLQREDFEWSSDFSFSLNRNKVVTIYGEDNDGDGIEDDLVSSGYFIGRSLGTIYHYKINGMWQQEDVDNGTIMDGMRPGDYKLEDVPDENGEVDGKITSDKDRQFLGVSAPNFRWSLTNNLRYKDLTFMVYLYSIWGGDGYYMGANTPYFDGYAQNEAINHPVYDYWTPENTGAEFPRPNYKSNTPYQATRYFDRSFIKLQKIALSYNLTKLVKPIGINGMNATLSADNLFTYAPHWIGLDPETGQGLTDTSRPSMRTYLLSFSFNF